MEISTRKEKLIMNKPPLGVTPKKIHELLRIQELSRAIFEYSCFEPENLKIELLTTWIEELNDRLYNYKYLLEEEQQKTTKAPY
jgi:hypothetical protein